MTCNLLHLARQLEDRHSFPNHGNDRNALKAGCSSGFENSERRVYGPMFQTRA